MVHQELQWDDTEQEGLGEEEEFLLEFPLEELEVRHRKEHLG